MHCSGLLSCPNNIQVNILETLSLYHFGLLCIMVTSLKTVVGKA